MYHHHVKFGCGSDVVLKPAVSTVRGECGQMVMRYEYFWCTGLVCRPDGLWRPGCPSGIVLPTLTLKVDGQVMLLES